MYIRFVIYLIFVCWLVMGSEIIDFDLENGSKGVEGEEYYLIECVFLNRIGVYFWRFVDNGRIVCFFRDCWCGKYSK